MENLKIKKKKDENKGVENFDPLIILIFPSLRNRFTGNLGFGV
jgi:hypothetical protein